MPSFTYKARDAAGKLVGGRLRASSSDAAAKLLRSHHLVPVSVTAIESVPLWQRSIGGRSIGTRDLILLFRQLSSMIKSGLPVLEAIGIIMNQTHKTFFRRTLADIKYDIESGSSLSGAMNKHNLTFSPFILGVVKTGEASGSLSKAFESVADYLEIDYEFVRKVRAAFAYPVFVVVLVIILSFILFIFVLPQLVELFEEAGATLPLPTRILIGVTTFIQSYWYILIALGVTGVFILRSYLRTPEGRYTISNFALQIPLVRTLLTKLYLARLTSVLYTLFSSDVPVLESLTLARDAVGNRVYQRVLDDTVAAIKDGSSISSVWRHEPYVPPMLTSMVEVGERGGTLDKSFKEASSFFRRDVEAALDTIAVLLEPLLIIILGIGVGIVVAAVLLPIYNLVLVF
ncbi:MAG: type II secretion system F family protein [Candidatus Andersenbacteria bacterium]|nr:type II secretion system F family protein [Candidatus Andersenbacteria bacterium]